MNQVASNETRDIGLRFSPSGVAGTAEIVGFLIVSNSLTVYFSFSFQAIYVNDEQDRNVESLGIKLAYVNVGYKQ